MAILVSIVLAVLALAFVLYPLLHRAPMKNNGGEPGETVPIVSTPSDAEREQAARDALREVELDFQLGNIAEQDYRRLRERYVQRALIALKSRYDREQELDTLIEDQLRKLKEQRHDAIQ
jgi:hypothetical protein